MQIKTATTTGTFDWIYAGDEAFDPELFSADELSMALLSGDSARWQKMLKPEAKPAVWRLRHLGGKARMYLRDLAMTGERVLSTAFWDAVSLSLSGVTGLYGPAGPIKLKQRAQHAECKAPCLSDADMEMLAQIDDGALVISLGNAIFERMAGADVEEDSAQGK